MGYRRQAERTRPRKTKQCHACTIKPGDWADYSDSFGYSQVVDVQQRRSRVRIELADGRVYRPRANELWWRASRSEL
jgi:hypothetical protein